jgi:hypothetical protein
MSTVAVAWTMAAIAASATVAEGYNQYQQGKDQKKAYDANANILRQNAARKRMETSLNEDILRSQNRKQAAKAQAAFGEAGMITSATTTGVLGQMGAEQEQNVLNQRYVGETEAVNYMNQANLQNYYGKNAKAQGRNAFKMSFLQAVVNGASAYFGVTGAASALTAAPTGGTLTAAQGAQASSAFRGGSQAAGTQADVYARLGMLG